MQFSRDVINSITKWFDRTSIPPILFSDTSKGCVVGDIAMLYLYEHQTMNQIRISMDAMMALEQMLLSIKDGRKVGKEEMNRTLVRDIEWEGAVAVSIYQNVVGVLIGLSRTCASSFNSVDNNPLSSYNGAIFHKLMDTSELAELKLTASLVSTRMSRKLSSRKLQKADNR